MIRYELRRLLTRAAALAVCCFSLGLVHTSVIAGWTHPQSSSGWTVDWDGGRMQPTAQWVPATTTNAAGGASWAVSGGNLAGSGTGRINNGPGYIDVQAKVIPTKPTVAGAIARAARRLGPLAQGLAIVDLAMDLGHILTGSGDDIVYQRVDPTICTVGPCRVYRVAAWTQAWVSTTPQAACTAAAVGLRGGSGYLSNSDTFCQILNADGSYWGGRGIDDSTVAPSSSNIVPGSEQAFIDAIALASGWPTSANFPKAVAQAIESGESIDGPVTVTGPATSQGSKTTTTDSAGNVTQQQTTYNYSYADNRVSYTTTVVTTVNGVTQSTEVREDEKPGDECEGSTDARCADLDTPETEVPKSEKNLTYAPEDLGLGDGSCPAPIPVNTSRGNWSIDLSPYCTATVTYVRPMVILVAMFLAYLIMTGTKLGGD